MTVMSIDELRLRPGAMRRAVSSGEQVQVTYHGKPAVTCVETSLWTRLVELAGDAGRQLLAQAREESVA